MQRSRLSVSQGALVFSMLPALLGCSLIFGDADRARIEGPPEVTLTPAEPTTVDDLVVKIDKRSLDGNGNEVVEYLYEWSLDGTPESSESGDTIEHTNTTKGQTWSVRVTPIVGNKRGPFASAAVTIVNAKPVIGGFGLSRYRIMEGDSITAKPYDVEDADSDRIVLEYEWTDPDGKLLTDSDGNELPDARRSTLDTSNLVGQTIVASVTARETGEDGASTTRSIEGLVVEERVTAWRPLFPTMEQNFLTTWIIGYQLSENRIVLRDGNGQHWERSLLEFEPWVPIYPQGNLYATWNATHIYDATGERFIIVGGARLTDEICVDGKLQAALSDAVQVLTLDRGNERYTLVGNAETPSGARAAAVAVDTEHGTRVYMLFSKTTVSPGTTSGDAGTSEDATLHELRLWFLDVDVKPLEWKEIDVSIPDLLNTSLAYFDGFLHIVGGELRGSGQSVNVLRVEHVGMEGTVQELGVLDAPFMADARIAVDPTGSRIFTTRYRNTAFGTNRAKDLWRLDLATSQQWERVPLDWDPGGRLVGIQFDSSTNRLVYIGSSTAGSRLAFDFGTIDPVSGEVVEFEREGLTYPSARTDAVGQRAGLFTGFEANNYLHLVAGGTGPNGPNEDAWVTGRDFNTWEQIDVIDRDAITSGASFSPAEKQIFVFSGVDGSEELGTVPFRMNTYNSDGSPTLRGTALPQGPPKRMDGASVSWSGPNNSRSHFVAGGWDLGAALTHKDSWLLSCRVFSCSWCKVADTDFHYPVGANLAYRLGNTFAFFGFAPGFQKTTNAVRTLRPPTDGECPTESAAWFPAQVHGEPPPARHNAAHARLGSAPVVAFVGGVDLEPVDCFPDGTVLNDVWTATLDSDGSVQWKELSPSDKWPKPPARQGAVLVHDVERRVVLFGGRAGITLYNDAWELEIPE